MTWKAYRILSTILTAKAAIRGPAALIKRLLRKEMYRVFSKLIRGLR